MWVSKCFQNNCTQSFVYIYSAMCTVVYIVCAYLLVPVTFADAHILYHVRIICCLQSDFYEN